MKKLIMICCLVMTVVFITSCEKEPISTENNTLINKSEVNSTGLFDQEFNLDEIPAATVELKTYSKSYGLNKNISLKDVESCTDPLLPVSLESSLLIGESVVENKTACLSGVPPKGDILFAMDLTGSMGGEINNLKNNSINIISSIKNNLPNSYFGLMSFIGYGYTPFILDQSITQYENLVTTAISGLSLGYGYCESYKQTFIEAYSNPAISWRNGSAKIIVYWLDESGYAQEGCSPYGDPTLDEVIAELANQNIKLIVLSSGTSYVTSEWLAHSEVTGGTAVQINPDGTIPGGVAIEDVITGLIEESVSTISSLTLEANPAVTYSSWLSTIPASHTNLDLESAQEVEFELTITVPGGTADGVYNFDVDLVGDGAIYGTQTVAITVKELTIDIDGCDSGVLNKRTSGGEIMSDKIDALEAVTDYKNHGQFVGAMAKMVEGWYLEDLLTLEEKDLIMECAGESSIGVKVK